MTLNRDWSIAIQKASNAIVEALAFDTIRDFYLKQDPPIRMNRIDYNSGLDLAQKQKFDLIDAYGLKWEIKSDRIAVTTGRVFIEALDHSDFDYLLIFAAGFGHILPRQTYLDIIANPNYLDARGGDNQIAEGKFVPLEELLTLSL